MFSREHHTYPRIQINSVSKTIIEQLSIMLSDLEIEHLTREKKNKLYSDSYEISVYGRKRLEIWKTKIGFANANHSTRYEIFKRKGFVPPNTTYNQRKKIIEGRLDALSFYKLA